MRKWLNISAKESDYSADTEEDDSDSGASDTEGVFYASVWLVGKFGFRWFLWM